MCGSGIAEIVDRFDHLNIWEQKGVRAPYKPLLLILMIARYQNGQPRLVKYVDIENQLHDLFALFGPPRRDYYPQLPFWHLKSDKLWELPGVLFPANELSQQGEKRRFLVENRVAGGLTEELFEAVQNEDVAARVLEVLLDGHFPCSLHERILRAVGIRHGNWTFRLARDPEFRRRVMSAYRAECAICGFSSKVADDIIGVEAAHIKWHQAGGPDVEQNGIALCSLHHSLFDAGVIAVDENHEIRVSKQASGPLQYHYLVVDFGGKAIQEPTASDYLPGAEYVAWHLKQVFRGSSDFE